ncbi:MAG: hypothetical protein ACPGLV_14615, partial [Bacteroidia bacterium]
MQSIKLFLPALFTLLIITTSCEIINPDEPIPSYIKVDSYGVSTDYIYEGSARQDINDIWAVHNGLVLATVPMPCTIPILQDKSNIVTLYPGIKVSATSTNRKIYPFFDGIDVELDFDNKGSITTVNQEQLIFKYKENLNFLWLEDFESDTYSIQKVNNDSA